MDIKKLKELAAELSPRDLAFRIEAASDEDYYNLPKYAVAWYEDAVLSLNAGTAVTPFKMPEESKKAPEAKKKAVKKSAPEAKKKVAKKSAPEKKKAPEKATKTAEVASPKLSANDQLRLHVLQEGLSCTKQDALDFAESEDMGFKGKGAVYAWEEAMRFNKMLGRANVTVTFNE